MNDFTARNGAIIHRTPSGKLAIGNYAVLNSHEEQALREFFQHERDQELGRWRWPENPDYVVYTVGDGWLALSERSGNSKHYSRREHAQVGTSILTHAMRAYLDAHPEPKPWHDAKPWEAWVVTVDGIEQAVSIDEDREFRDRSYPKDNSWMHITDARITAGRRIWPEDAS